MKGVGGSAVSSRVFLTLGTVVVALVAFRFVLRVISGLTVWQAAASRDGAPSASAFVLQHGTSLLVGGLAAGALFIAVAAGVLRRRPWALPVAVAIFAVTAAVAVGVAVFQISALARGSAVFAGAAEIGYGPLFTFWRISGCVAALLLALFCAASLRRLASDEMRREFSGLPRRPGAPR